MTPNLINRLRLQNQLLSKVTSVRTPYDIVHWFRGMQAQDYQSAKWAIGVRLPDSTDNDIEKALADKSIVRTWAMRGTIQFVAAEDIWWLTDLLAGQRLASNTYRYNQLNLDSKLLKKCNGILEKNLQGGKELSRNEIKQIFKQKGIDVDGVQLSHILQNATYEKLVCYGVKKGADITFALLEEWVPEKKLLEREAALAELTSGYFRSRGPASLKDYIWWSGLTARNAREGIDLIKDKLTAEKINDATYWISEEGISKGTVRKTLILPAFDEYLISYQNRSSMIDKEINSILVHNNGMFNPVIVSKGKVTGTWKRVIKKDSVEITLKSFTPLNNNLTNSIRRELKSFGKFLNKEIKLSAIK